METTKPENKPAESGTIEVRLLGQRLVLKSSESDPELIRQVLDLVSAKLKDAEERSRSAPAHQVALLALLDLAEAHLKAKKKTVDFKKQIEAKTNHLFSLIESELSAQ